MSKHRGWWFIFSRFKLLMEQKGQSSLVPPLLHDPSELGFSCVRKRRLGSLNGIDCYSCTLDDAVQIPPGITVIGLRRLFGMIPDDLFGMANLAIHLAYWDNTTLFCSRCGSPVEDRQDVRAKQCGQCGLLIFPRISPAVIVLVRKKDQVLLARSERFEKGLFSVLAGFVEPGETLEAAVSREVREEVGISISHITYFGSQPWPFPDSLMIGFTAEYLEGDISIDGEEIVEAGWYGVGNLPKIPDKISIARRLIDCFIASQFQESSQ
jgi:NAD+ diphosphatase